jgi:hypothetical protein
MVAMPTVAPTTVIEQVPPEERLQEAGDGRATVPEPPEGCENVIVSPVTDPMNPVTAAVQVEVPPTLIGDVQPMATVARRTVRRKVPELGALTESPPYDAANVTPPLPLPVTVIEHEPEARVQVLDEKDTEEGPLDCDQVTMPVDEPATVAVHVAVVPVRIEEGVQEAVVGEMRNGS